MARNEDIMTIRRAFQAMVFGAVVFGAPVLAAAGAQAPVAGVSGASTFGVYCASCHGSSAKGDGPLASVLRSRPADLTLIAKRNGGSFPTEQVARIIDGRRQVKGHGGGDMPVWGDAFAKSLSRTPVDETIRRLTGYLESIQAKP